MLPYDPSAVAELVAELDSWRDLLDHRGALPRRWAGRMRRDLEAESVAASTSMEGIPVTVEEVHRILVGVRPGTVSEHDAELVRGYRDAMEFALRRADDPGFVWNRELLVALQDRILAGRFRDGAGRLRTAPAYVVNSTSGDVVFAPPEAAQVPSLIDRAMEQMEQGHPHPALSAAWVHVAIAAVHPFRDGNGRAARISASLAMLRDGFRLPEFTSLEEWWGRHLSDYYAAFTVLGDLFDTSVDVTPFIRAHLEAQLRQVRALDLRERVQRQIWLAVEEAIAERGLAPRVANAAWDAFFGRDVTNAYYRELADVTDVTASTDLKGAVAAGFLRAEGAGRARHYVAGDSLYRDLARYVGLEVAESGEIGSTHLIVGLTQRVHREAEARRRTS